MNKLLTETRGKLTYFVDTFEELKEKGLLVDKPIFYSRRNSTGYGSKIPTSYMMKHNNRMKRVSAMCYGNSCTLYVISNDQKIIIS